MIPYKLLQDLNKLACVSGNKKVEDLFVKLSQESSSTFSDWVQKNKNNRHLASIIGDKTILKALSHLYGHMYSEPPEGWRMNMIQNHPSYMAVYGPCFRLLAEGKHQEILAPLTNILANFSSVRPNPILTDEKADQDLAKIHQEYAEYTLNHQYNQTPPRRGLTQKEKTRLNHVQLFNIIFSFFSKELSDLASSSPHLSGLSGIISQGGLLDPSLIYSNMPHGPTDFLLKNAVKFTGPLVNKALQDGKDGEFKKSYYNLKLNILGKSKLLHAQQVEYAKSQFQIERMKGDSSQPFSFDNLLSTPEEGATYEDLEDSEVNKLFNPYLLHSDFILLTSMVVSAMSQKLNITSQEIKMI